MTDQAPYTGLIFIRDIKTIAANLAYVKARAAEAGLQHAGDAADLERRAQNLLRTAGIDVLGYPHKAAEPKAPLAWEGPQPQTPATEQWVTGAEPTTQECLVKQLKSDIAFLKVTFATGDWPEVSRVLDRCMACVFRIKASSAPEVKTTHEFRGRQEPITVTEPAYREEIPTSGFSLDHYLLEIAKLASSGLGTVNPDVYLRPIEHYARQALALVRNKPEAQASEKEPELTACGTLTNDAVLNSTTNVNVVPDPLLAKTSGFSPPAVPEPRAELALELVAELASIMARSLKGTLTSSLMNRIAERASPKPSSQAWTVERVKNHPYLVPGTRVLLQWLDGGIQNRIYVGVEDGRILLVGAGPGFNVLNLGDEDLAELRIAREDGLLFCPSLGDKS